MATLATLLPGCATREPVRPVAAVSLVQPDAMFASLAPGDVPVGLAVQHIYPNAVRQEIALGGDSRTPGENRLRIDVFSSAANPHAVGAALDDAPLPQVDLAGEAAAAVPGTAMRVSLTYVQNRYGPFGYAVGRSPQGDTCLYAWQRVSTPDAELSLARRRETVAVRLRLCRSGAGEASLVGVMRTLTLAALADDGWNPFSADAPPPPAAGLGGVGAPMGPTAGPEPASRGLPAALADIRMARPGRRPARRIVQAAAQPMDEPTPMGPAVPMPAIAMPAIAMPAVVVPGPRVPPPDAGVAAARAAAIVPAPPPGIPPGAQP